MATTARRCWTTPAPKASAVYRCANKQVDGYAVYTNTVPAGAFRGYGLPQTSFAVESRDRRTGARHRHGRRSNSAAATSCGRGEPMLSTGEVHDDVIYGSYGLDQCLDLVDAALKRGDGDAPPSRGMAGRAKARRWP